MTDGKRFLSVKNAVEYSSLSEPTIRRMLVDGGLQPCRPFGTDRVMIDKDDLDRLMRGEPTRTS
jgi:excisionase family DNA binding protein